MTAPVSSTAPALAGSPPNDIDSARAWRRLGAAVLLGLIGNVGMWSVVVALPAVQAEFGLSRAAVSLAYTFTMIGFAIGGVLTGRLADRFGILLPIVGGTLILSTGYVLAGLAPNAGVFQLSYGLLIGMLGSSALFGPLVAHVSLWFSRRRGIAVAVCASGNYIAGAVWPPIIQHMIETIGWRQTHIGIGVICLVTLLPLSLAFRRPPPATDAVPAHDPRRPVRAAPTGRPLPPNLLQVLLVVAGIACCVAMSMPQVHIVAYCGDLGYGAARGAEMLSLMLGLGIVSRLASGFLADRIGGLRTLLLGSILQGIALLLYLPFDGLTSLYVVSGLFGLFQGGIVPSYAIIVREYFDASAAATRVGLVFMATLLGMALGGWLSGVIFDLTGSYQAAFLNGFGWNLINVSIVVWLIRRLDPPILRGKGAGAHHLGANRAPVTTGASLSSAT